MISDITSGLTQNVLGKFVGDASQSASYSVNALSATTAPSDWVSDRSTEATYRDSAGKIRQALANEVRVDHAINGRRKGVIFECARTRRNHYPYPASGAVTDHFTANTGDITVVTNADNPISDDFTNNDQVWRITNSSGSDRTYPLAGTVGNTNPHNIRIWHKIISGTGHAIAQIGGQHSPWTEELFLNSRVGVEQTSLNITPSASTDQLEIVVPDGMTIEITLAEMQDNDVINSRYYAHATTPILHGIGAAATRADEIISISDINTKGYNQNAGSVVFHGTFLGGENTNSGFISLYDASSATTDFHYHRVSPNGDMLYYAEGGNVAFANEAYPISTKRRPTPLDIAIAWSWSNVDGMNLWNEGTYNYTNSNTNVPQNIDTLSFNRHDVSSRNNSSGVITKIEIYNHVLSNNTLKQKSYREYGFTDVTVAQSNIDIKMRGFGAAAILDDGDAGGGDYITTHFMNEYVPNYKVIRGTDYYDGTTDADYGGGALLKSTTAEAVDYFVNDDDANNLTDGLDLIKIQDTVAKNYGVNGKVNNFQIDLGPYENGRTVVEINGIVKQGMQYLIDRLKQIGGSQCKINFQMWTKRFNTDDEITWAWREMLRDIQDTNDNVLIIAEPYNYDLDPISNAHYDTERNYIDMYMHGQRKILKGLGIADFGNVDFPTISSAAYSGSTVTLNFNTEHGANITSGDLTILPKLFRIMEGVLEKTVSSASISGQTVTLTMAEALTGSVTADYPYRLMDYNQGRVNYILDPDNIVDNDNWSDIRGTLSGNADENPVTDELTASLFTESTENGAHDIYQDVDLVVDDTHDFSIYVKANGRTDFRMRLDEMGGTGDIQVNFDTVAETSESQSVNGVSTLSSHSISDEGNGWYKLSMSGIINSAGGTSTVRAYLYSMDGSSRDYTGDGTSGFYVFRVEINNTSDPIDENDAGTAALVDDSCYVNPVAQFSNYTVTGS